jgi:hypothetical protein
MKITTILTLVCLSATLSAQPGPAANPKKKNELTSQAKKINELLRQYDKLSPFSDKDADAIEPMGNEIVDRLLVLLNNERIVMYDLEKLLTGDQLVVSKSADKRVWFFSLDEKTGGSFRPFKTIVHYQLPDGYVKAELLAQEEENAAGVSAYGEIYLLDSLTGVYFSQGGVRTCNTCIAELAIILKPDTAGINMQIVAEYDGRDNNLQRFEYDSNRKELYLEYESPDETDTLYGNGDENENSGLQFIYKSRYRFMKGTFVEVEKCELLKE